MHRIVCVASAMTMMSVLANAQPCFGTEGFTLSPWYVPSQATCVATGGTAAVMGLPGQYQQVYMYDNFAPTPNGVVLSRWFGPPQSPNSTFGSAVAVDSSSQVSSTVLIGSPGIGSVYVYARQPDYSNNYPFALEGVLKANDHQSDSEFGRSIAYCCDTAIIGAPQADQGQGAAYVFSRSGSTWTQQAKLVGSDPFLGYLSFGTSVAISDSTAVIGSAGAAFVFVRTAGIWTQQAKLVADYSPPKTTFGRLVSISGNTLVVGDDQAEDLRGGVYVFDRTDGPWTQRTKITQGSPGFPGTTAYFPKSLAFKGNLLTVGAEGRHYIVVGQSDQWTLKGYFSGHPTIGSATAIGSSFVFKTPTDGNAVVAPPLSVWPQPARSVRCLGSSATFTALATPTTNFVPRSYQWRRCDTDLVDGISPSGSLVQGATSPTLTISGITRADRGTYQLFVTVDCGSVFSELARLDICGADLSCDQWVDDTDFVLFASAYDRLLCSDPSMPMQCPADLNADGAVDDADFVMFAAAYDSLRCP